MTAIPKTQLWRRLAREGRLLGSDHTGNNTDCSLNFVPKTDAGLLIEGYKTILRTIYDPREYYARSLDCLARLNRSGAPRPGRPSGAVADLAGLLRLVVTLGLRDKARREFWRYMYRLLVRHRNELEHGIMLAVMGYHFRKLTEQYCGQG